MKLVKAMILISMIFAFSLVSVAESRREKLSLKKSNRNKSEWNKDSYDNDCNVTCRGKCNLKTEEEGKLYKYDSLEGEKGKPLRCYCSVDGKKVHVNPTPEKDVVQAIVMTTPFIGYWECMTIYDFKNQKPKAGARK